MADVKFLSKEAIQLPTPSWATWFFRIEFVLNKMLLFYLTGASDMPPAQMKNTLLIAGTIDLGVWTLGRMVGVKKDAFDNDTE